MGKKILTKSTALNAVNIEKSGSQYHLKFDSDLDAIQSAIDLSHPHKLVMLNLQYLMGILLFIKPPENILILGVGGGSLVHFLSYYLPDSQITGLDYNAELIDLARQHFKLPEASSKITYVIADARDYMKKNKGCFDLILVDIFTDGRSPDWLLEQSFNRQLKDCLSNDGAVAFNLLIDNEKRFSRFYQLLRDLYQQQTLCLEHEDYENILVYGLNKEKPATSLEGNLQQAELLTRTYELPFTQILASIYNINPAGSGVI